jgi:uncharacterized protein involved in response to NO
MSHKPSFVPFAHGFRPFFLLALAFGLIAIPVWMAVRAAGFSPLPTLPPQLWHGHEMLYGFIAAAIAGFLLTAVPSWTGARGWAGWPLGMLAALWLTGRLAFGLAQYLPATVVAVAELLFLPALAALIAPSLLRARNRNTPLLLVLALLWLTDAIYLRAMASGNLPLASTTLRAGIDMVLLLITVIGGRIVPAFTSNALKRRGIEAPVRSHRLLDGATIAAMVLLAIVDIWSPTRPGTAIVAATAAVLQAVRLGGWQGRRSLGDPIVWVLHAAYLWLPVGLALKAIHLLTGAAWATHWLHALTIGAAATMIVAVITRASLGHTGRPLSVSRPVAIAYGLLLTAAVARVFLVPYEWAVEVAAGLWAAAFALVFIVYAPILMRPRVDGRPG